LRPATHDHTLRATAARRGLRQLRHIKASFGPSYDIEPSSILLKEAAMSHDSPQSHYPTVEFVLNAIADWVNNHRDSMGRGDLGQCTPDEVSRIANDMGMSTGQLRELVQKGPHAADQVQKMLIVLKVDPKHVAANEPVVMRDLQRLCIFCDDKKHCAHELAAGTAAAHFHDFCPNAQTLDALVKQEVPAK
jgi:hypothetical protein